jgi:hypothetical protein
MDPFPRDDADEEGDARQFLEQTEHESDRVVDVRRLFKECGITVSPRAPRACDGLVEWPPDRVHLNERGPEFQIQRRGFHEVGHFAKVIAGANDPPDEESTSRVGLRVQVPRGPLLTCWADVRRDLARLAELYPTIPQSDLYRRLAWALQFDVIFRLGHHRIPPANDGERLDLIMREHALYRAVLRDGQPANDSSGAVAAPSKTPARAKGS